MPHPSSPSLSEPATNAPARVDIGEARADSLLGGFPEAVLDASPDAIVTLDCHGFVSYANPAAARLLGTPISELIRKPSIQFVADPEGFARIAETLRPTSSVEGRRLELRAGDGSLIPVSVSVSTLHQPDGKQIGAVAVFRDASGECRSVEDLERKNAELEHYVHAISHDLRSPLVSLLGFSRLLREDYGSRLDEKGRHFLDRIEQAGRTMESLIHDLLELSRIGESGEARTPVDPRDVLLQLRAELKPRLDAEHVDLEVPENPPLVLSNRVRLYQLFSNLLGNALDHMGDVAPREIRVDITEDDAYYRIRVRDNGRGIDAAHHERIFEIFETLGPRANGQRSTGIGLAIVKKIAETHGGRCWVESEPGRGAAFTVLLPRV